MTAPAAGPESAPLTWLLLGPKTGDNNQVVALAEALGWPYLRRQLGFRWYELATNRVLGETLAGVDRLHSDALEPPWPDLIITAGRRNEPVARWVRAQNGGKTRIVHLGRPWSPLEAFDLIVTTPQYFLPQSPHVLTLELPLHRVNSARLEEAGNQWQPRFEHLPRPWTAVLVGGNSGKYVLTGEKASRLGRAANRMAKAGNGSLLITDSVRTPPQAYAACLAELDVPAHMHHWHENARMANPYLGYLALADELVVTGESMSMLAEASATGKPLYIFDPGDDPSRPWWHHAHNFRFKPLSHRLGMMLGPKRMRRDVGRIQQALVDSGRAAWLGEPAPKGMRCGMTGDAGRAAERVRALFSA